MKEAKPTNVVWAFKIKYGIFDFQELTELAQSFNGTGESGMKKLVGQLLIKLQAVFEKNGVHLPCPISCSLDQDFEDTLAYEDFIQTLAKFINESSVAEGILNKISSLISSNLYDFQYLKFIVLRKITGDYAFIKSKKEFIVKQISTWSTTTSNDEALSAYLAYYPKLLNSLYETDIFEIKVLEECISLSKSSPSATLIQGLLDGNSCSNTDQSSYTKMIASLKLSNNISFLKHELELLVKRRELIGLILNPNKSEDYQACLKAFSEHLQKKYELVYFIRPLLKGAFIVDKEMFNSLLSSVSNQHYSALCDDESLFKAIYSVHESKKQIIDLLKSKYIEFGNVLWFNFCLGYELVLEGKAGEAFLMLKQVEEVLFDDARNESKSVTQQSINSSAAIILLVNQDRTAKIAIADSVFQKVCKYLSDDYIQNDHHFRLEFGEIFATVCESCAKFAYAENVLDKLKKDSTLLKLNLPFRSRQSNNQDISALRKKLLDLISLCFDHVITTKRVEGVFIASLKGKLKSGKGSVDGSAARIHKRIEKACSRISVQRTQHFG